MSSPADVQRRIANFSTLQRERAEYRNVLPQVLQSSYKLVDTIKYHTLSDEILQKHFPHTSQLTSLEFVPSETKSTTANRRVNIGVVFCGRQTPGGHNVVAGLFDFLKSSNPESKLYGFIDGTRGLFAKKSVEITSEILAAYRNQGGFDMLGRTVDSIRQPSEMQATLDVCNELALDGLILVGGPTTLTFAAYLAEFFVTKQSKTKIIVTPGSIDGDLKHRLIESVFGFDTACKVYSELVGNIAIDGNSACKYYYFIRLMGRAPSHITLECALQTNPNHVIIGEEVEAQMKPLSDVVDDVCDVIVERAKLGKNYGVILFSEGLVSSIPEIKLLITELNDVLSTLKRTGNDNGAVDINDHEALEKYVTSKISPWNAAIFTFMPFNIRQQLLLERESGGNIQLSQIEMEKLLAELVDAELKKRKAKGEYKGAFAPITQFLGYQARSSLPSQFDANLAYTMGYAAAALVADTETKATGVAMSIRNLLAPANEWKVWAVPISMLMCSPLVKDESGSSASAAASAPIVPSRKVDINGKTFAELKKHRDSWVRAELYSNPGPIQFEGISADARLMTLRAEQTDVIDKLQQVDQLCETLKTACRSNATSETLNAAVIGLKSLTQILDLMETSSATANATGTPAL